MLVLCDDVGREYGDPERAASQADEAQEDGWTTIYGEGVVKTQLPADDQELAQAA